MTLMRFILSLVLTISRSPRIRSTLSSPTTSFRPERLALSTFLLILRLNISTLMAMAASPSTGQSTSARNLRTEAVVSRTRHLCSISLIPRILSTIKRALNLAMRGFTIIPRYVMASHTHLGIGYVAGPQHHLLSAILLSFEIS